jgi:hypothetical protein
MRRVLPHWGRADELLPTLDAVKDDFRKKFDRDMTPEEIHLYKLTKDMLESPGDNGFIDRRVMQLKVERERRLKKAKSAEEGQ